MNDDTGPLPCITRAARRVSRTCRTLVSHRRSQSAAAWATCKAAPQQHAHAGESAFRAKAGSRQAIQPASAHPGTLCNHCRIQHGHYFKDDTASRRSAWLQPAALREINPAVGNRRAACGRRHAALPAAPRAWRQALRNRTQVPGIRNKSQSPRHPYVSLAT